MNAYGLERQWSYFKVFHIFLREVFLIRCNPFLARDLAPMLLDIGLSSLVQARLGRWVHNHILSILYYYMKGGWILGLWTFVLGYYKLGVAQPL